MWQAYLTDPDSLCFVNEDAGDFDALYANHVRLNVADNNGSMLSGTLDDKVSSWLADREARSLLLLGDFGEGKSFFTYCLARRLSERFVDARPDAFLPLRLPLREFRTAGSARVLLQQRLAEFGATVADWRGLTKRNRTLAILDGFDEMSISLSPATVTGNVRNLAQCVQEVGSTKILVTSRGRVLDGGRDQERILDRIYRPEVIHIAPISRRQRVKYLESVTTDQESANALVKIRELYDPIGLAAKPLFLQMIRETLHVLPKDDLDEMILYRTYIKKSLERKIEFLEDDESTVTYDELIENLLHVLEEVALRLQLANEPYVCLREFTTGNEPQLAEMLWKMKDAPSAHAPTNSNDATARVGIRSLLKAVPGADPEQWPVDFFHRSMREYFVARAIVQSLTADRDRARSVLRKLPPTPEVTHFAEAMLRNADSPEALATLESFARSASIDLDEHYLGGNAITLLYAARGGLPAADWSRLRLDYASLPGADLRGARFVGASLRHANLDNANLEDADFTDADLEGVRLDETAPVLAVTTLPGNRIAAAYGDQTVHEWRGRPDGRFENRLIANLDYRPRLFSRELVIWTLTQEGCTRPARM